ncbi:MAG: glycosyltransferase family 2 protein [Actinobacteria bacterium]|nr:glycosyltransferase family 2 protein [Actinomycetota bacterium]
MKSVSVIILNWNGKALIEKCVESVLDQDYKPLKVILIDNASTDNSLELVSKYSPVSIIKNDTNKGFAKAMNEGIKLSDGDYILLLNYDIILQQDFVSEMVKAIESSERIGSVSGKLLRLNSTKDMPVIDSTGHIIFRNRLAENRGENEIDKGQFNQIEFVFGTCGAAAFYRREMLEDIKVNDEYFDEAFFAFWEVVDLDWRAQLRGWQCIYTPYAIAYHERGGPFLRRSKFVELHNYKNRYFLMIKNDSFWSILKKSPQLLFTEILKGTALIFRCPSALKGWFYVAKELPAMFSKRRIIQERRLISQAEIERWFVKFNYLNWMRRNLF